MRSPLPRNPRHEQAVFEFGARLAGFCRVLTGGNVALADDLSQEAWIRYFRRWPDDPPDNQWGYIKVVATNLWRSWLKAQRRRREVEFADLEIVMPEEEPLASAEVASAALVAALEALPTRNRYAIQRKYIDRASCQEIADETDTSPGNVSKLIYRGIRQLSDRLRAGYGGE